MSLLRRVLNLFSLLEIDKEIDFELQTHIEMRIEENMAAGMSAEDARRDALLRFGNFSRTKERVTRVETALMLCSIWSDLRYACRQLRKKPGFSVTVILVLALGMCTSVAIFAFVEAVLIRPLPYQSPSRLAALFESTPLGQRYHLSYLDYLDWKRQNKVFQSLEAYDNTSFAMKTAEGTQLVDGVTVSSGFFRTLGVAPMLGRDFHDGEDKLTAPHTVVLSYAAWQKRYGEQPDVLGKIVTLESTPHTIIGVLPKEFHFAPAGSAEFWTTLHIPTDPTGRGEHGLFAIALLKDKVTLEAAAVEMSAIAQRLAKQYPDSDGERGATVVPLTDVIVGNLRPILLLLWSGATLLLLIACVNVSGLLLIRSENRRHEIAVRGALGASRTRILRQFVTEGVMLAVVGSLLGAGAAFGTVRLLAQLVPVELLTAMPYLQQLGLNPRVIGFAAMIGVMMAVLFSLTPTLRLPLADLRSGLTESGRNDARASWRHLGANLVVLELCTAMVLLVGAGLLSKSFYQLLHVDIGIQPDHLAMMRLRAPVSRYPSNEKVVALARRVMEEIGRLPGAQSVAVTHGIPVANVASGNTAFQVIGKPQNGKGYESSIRQVGATYFSTMQARLARGRYFTDAEDAARPRVMIVNQAFARKYFSGEDPVGKHIRYDADSPVIEIAGVVDDIKEGPLDTEVQPVLYIPFNQQPDSTFFVVVRTAEAPQELAKSLEETVHRVDPDIMTFDTETMEDRIHHTQSAYLHRFSAWLVGGFAAMALLLSVVGLYSVIAYSVSQRTKEIGVRMALGAQRSYVYQLILREAGELVAIGILAGGVCSVIAASLMRNLLFGTAPWDAGTLAGVSVVLAASALLASFIPAQRAASVDPIEALRVE